MDGNDVRVFDCPVCVILALAFNRFCIQGPREGALLERASRSLSERTAAEVKTSTPLGRVRCSM